MCVLQTFWSNSLMLGLVMVSWSVCDIKRGLRCVTILSMLFTTSMGPFTTWNRVPRVSASAALTHSILTHRLKAIDTSKWPFIAAQCKLLSAPLTVCQSLHSFTEARTKSSECEAYGFCHCLSWKSCILISASQKGALERELGAERGSFSDASGFQSASHPLRLRWGGLGTLRGWGVGGREGRLCSERNGSLCEAIIQQIYAHHGSISNMQKKMNRVIIALNQCFCKNVETERRFSERFEIHQLRLSFFQMMWSLYIAASTEPHSPLVV